MSNKVYSIERDSKSPHHMLVWCDRHYIGAIQYDKPRDSESTLTAANGKFVKQFWSVYEAATWLLDIYVAHFMRDNTIGTLLTASSNGAIM